MASPAQAGQRGGGGGTLAEDVGLPETDPAVRLEGGHRAHRAAVDEEGAVPLDALLDLGAGGVHHLAQVLDDRLGEGGSLTRRSLTSAIDTTYCLAAYTPRLQGRACSVCIGRASARCPVR